MPNMNNVRELREAKGWRREELAVKAGVSHGYLCDLEAGRYVPGLTRARRIADVLGVSVDAAFPPTPEAQPAGQE